MSNNKTRKLSFVWYNDCRFVHKPLFNKEKAMSVLGDFFSFGTKEAKPGIFGEADHKKLARPFIGKCHIYQALRFGEVGKDGLSDTISICFVIEGDSAFWRYETLYQSHLPADPDPSEEKLKEVRLLTFNALWGGFGGDLIRQLPGKEPFLPHQLNLVVLPTGWQNRVAEIVPRLRLRPEAIEFIKNTGHILLTHV